MNQTDTNLKRVSDILLRSFIIAMALLILWMLLYFTTGDYWYLGHSQFFDITEHELSLINYAGMGLFKIMAFCFLLCPFIAIQTMIRLKKIEKRPE